MIIQPRFVEFHVHPHRRVWRVYRDGELLSLHCEKDLAVEEARRLARAHAPARMTIHAPSGRIETDHTYWPDIVAATNEDVRPGHGTFPS
ncbi:DUF2188 domain-containing protein [Actinopolymorpha pittospori]